ncbi:SRPBCC family protein [Nocardiopsis aegyptia]|uniref:SRPBCC family protein n=1 Tax=Nocardiopsis aegyptia TaxID=220378 RepID=UPI00366A84B9
MIDVAKTVDADRSSVWQVMSDLDRWAEVMPTIDRISRVGEDGPITVGTRFRVRQPGLAEAVYEITAWEPGTGFTWQAKVAGVRTVASHDLRADGAGTRIRLGVEWTGPGAWLVRLLFARKTRAFITREVQALADLTEGRQTS